MDRKVRSPGARPHGTSRKSALPPWGPVRSVSRTPARSIMCCAAWEMFVDQAGHNAEPLDCVAGSVPRVFCEMPRSPVEQKQKTTNVIWGLAAWGGRAAPRVPPPARVDPGAWALEALRSSSPANKSRTSTSGGSVRFPFHAPYRAGHHTKPGRYARFRERRSAPASRRTDSASTFWTAAASIWCLRTGRVQPWGFSVILYLLHGQKGKPQFKASRSGRASPPV